MKIRRFRSDFAPLLFIAVAVVVVFVLVRVFFFAGPRQVEQVVQQFYEYEQVGDFAGSWALFHPLMHEKFPKGAYIQDRAHVFMGHFGVETFDFTIGSIDAISDWRMSSSTQRFGKVYAVPVTQSYEGKYGVFEFSQTVYVTKVKGEWLILWDYGFE